MIHQPTAGSVKPFVPDHTPGRVGRIWQGTTRLGLENIPHQNLRFSLFNLTRINSGHLEEAVVDNDSIPTKW